MPSSFVRGTDQNIERFTSTVHYLAQSRDGAPSIQAGRVKATTETAVAIKSVTPSDLQCDGTD